MNNITTAVIENACPRCMGSGKTGFRPSNGVCYKCNGIGFLAGATSTTGERSHIELLKSGVRFDAPAVAVATAPVSDDWLKEIFA